MDTTESKTNLEDWNTFTIFLKMSHKATESIKVFSRMVSFFVRCFLFKDYVKNHYQVYQWPSHIEHFYQQHVTLNL